MSEWRPDDWENPYLTNYEWRKRHRKRPPCKSHIVLFEAGADEMYKACCKNWKLLVPKGYIAILKSEYRLLTGVNIE